MIESEMHQIIGKKQPIQRIEVARKDLQELFAYNKFKLRILDEIVTNDKVPIYRCGNFVDLSLGPHIKHTGKLKAVKVTKVCMIQYCYVKALAVAYLNLSSYRREHHSGRETQTKKSFSEFTASPFRKKNN